ncbi:MAG: radical SAM/SPASM domain-containing protein [Candidatus Aenigmatarchaeota archaeon]
MINKKIIDNLKKWERGKTGPFRIQLNPTNRCNLECRFCWQRTEEKIDYTEVSDQRYLDLIEEAGALNVREIEITGGGEPLMRKDLVFKLMEKIKDNGMKGKLITNGTNLKESDLRKIIKFGWDEIVFSVDGTGPTHEYLRRCKGCFKDTLSSMKKLNKLKNKLPEVTMHMVLCNQNYEEIADSVKIANDVGCENFFIEPVVTLAFDTDLGKNLKMDKEEIKDSLGNIKKAKNLAEKLDINHNFDSLHEELIVKTNKMDKVIEKDSKNHSESKESGLAGAACYEPWYSMIVRPEGYVGPCCMFDNEGPNIKNKSLEGVWFGDYFERIRQNMLENKLLSFCSKCNPSQVHNNREIRKKLNG